MADPQRIAVRGTTAKLNAYAGPWGVIGVDTDTGALVAQNGQAGGVRMALEKDAVTNLAISGTTLTVTKGNGLTSTVTLPSAGEAVSYEPASAAAAGLMSAADKAKLDGIATGATKDSISVTATLSTGTQIGSITVNGTTTNLYAPAATAGSTPDVATSTTAGLMSAADKAKLDGIANNASAVSVTPDLSSGTQIGSITVDGITTKLYAPASAAAPGVVTSSTDGLMSAADKSKLDGIALNAAAVSVTSALSSGTQIGSITVNGTTTALYAPAAAIDAATSTAAGLMSADDKAKLDGIASNATAVTVTPSLDSGTQIGTITIDNSTFTLYAPAAVSSVATSSSAGLMSAADKSKLDGIATGATKDTISVTQSLSSGTQIGSITVNGTTTRLYAPAATTSVATTSSSGLMSASDKTKLNGIATGATATTVSVSQSLSSGTQIGSITVNGSTTKLYAPAASSGPSLSSSNTWTGSNWFSGYVGIYTGGSIGYLYINKTASTSGSGCNVRSGFNGTASSIGLEIDNGNRVAIWNDSSKTVFSDDTGNGSMQLGSATHKWAQLYASTTTISTSDERCKTAIENIPDAVLDAWGAVEWKRFKFNDAVAKKGAAARYHTGLVAQAVEQNFSASGVTAADYGFLCHDIWEASEAVIDEKSGEVAFAAQEAGDEYSMRYEEALCIEAAYQRRRAERAEARLTALEQEVAAIKAQLVK